MGRPFSPKNLPLPMGGSGPPSNTWFAGPTQVLDPKGSSIGAAVFAGLTSVTDRPTDHATRSVRIGRIYVHSTAMRPKNIMSAFAMQGSHNNTMQSSVKKQRAKNKKRIKHACKLTKLVCDSIIMKTRMWANAQRDGRPAEHRWRPLFNAAKFG